jgi:hypothetical protein
MNAPAPHTHSNAGLTARQIIERRLGRKLPVLRELAEDEREAIKGLALMLIRARVQK